MENMVSHPDAYPLTAPYTIDLLPGLPVIVDSRTSELGGSFWPERPPRVYDPEPLQWVWDRIKDIENPILLDIGASTGCYTLLAAHHKGLHVFAFEPVPLAWDVLTANVQLNDLEDRVHTWKIAVGEHEGVDTFHVVEPESQIGISMLGGKPAYTKCYHDLIMRVITIDMLYQEDLIIPTVIKIDTEGGELAVLRGADRTLTLEHPAIVCEYNVENADQYGYHPDELIRFLSRYNYNIRKGDNDLYAC